MEAFLFDIMRAGILFLEAAWVGKGMGLWILSCIVTSVKCREERIVVKQQRTCWVSLLLLFTLVMSLVRLLVCHDYRPMQRTLLGGSSPDYSL